MSIARRFLGKVLVRVGNSLTVIGCVGLVSTVLEFRKSTERPRGIVPDDVAE